MFYQLRCFPHPVLRRTRWIAATFLAAACAVVDQTGPNADIAQLIVSPDTVSVVAGQMVQFQATGRSAHGQSRAVTVQWSATGGTIDASGLYTADVPAGSFSVTASLDVANLTTSVSVHNHGVLKPGPLKQVVLESPATSVVEGGTLQFSTVGLIANGDTVPVNASYSATGGTIDASGLYTAGNVVGAFQVIATVPISTRNGGSKSDTAQVTITGGGGTTSSVASVIVSPATGSIAVGQTLQLTATPKDAGGNPLAGRTITWSSGTPAVASVNGSGLVSGVAAGTDTVTATVEGKRGSAVISVTSATVPVASVTVSPATSSMQVGATVQLSAAPKDATGTVLTGRVITWMSSDVTVASVSSSGLVTGLLAGSATITATCEGKTGSATVTVSGSAPPPPTGGCTTPWPAAVYARMPLSTGQAYYVSASSGSDNNPGTIDQPWQTLQKAFDALQPGQIAYLRAGTYGGFCSAFTFSHAGTLTAPITVQGYPGEVAILHGQIRIDGSYFRLSNIVAEGPTCGTWGATTQQGDNMILMTPGLTHHVELSNSEVFHDGWHAGVSAGGDDLWILNNYIHDNGGFNDSTQFNTSHGIYYHDGSRGVVANNILEHNRAKGLSARYTGNHVLVINNTVVGNGRSGLDITEGTHDWIFANNIIMNNGNVNGGVGINTTGSIGGANNLEINNIFWNNGTSGTSNWDSFPTVTNNVVADPLLVNPASSVPSTTHQGYSNDYHLQAGSPAIDFASIVYALPFDIGGVCRPKGQGPDAGAVEQQ